LQTALTYRRRNGPAKAAGSSLERAVMGRLAVICIAVVLVAVGAARGLGAMATSGPSQPPVQADAATQGQPAPAPVMDSGEASIAKSADGQFWADAQVNGQDVKFLVDTGATSVSLTPDDARRLGFNPDALTYNLSVITANGPGRGAEVTLGTVSVGRAQVYDVKAIVIDKGLGASLLGMSYLGRLSKVEATPDAMVLHS
jgi:aspartyl protease family protein